MTQKKVPKTPEEITEEARKKEESIARYKKELIQDISEWLEKIKTGNYTINKVDLQATKDHVSMGVVYPKNNSYSRY